eukprot:6167931-Lingulodinium_polyedra.AAC.1
MSFATMADSNWTCPWLFCPSSNVATAGSLPNFTSTFTCCASSSKATSRSCVAWPGGMSSKSS